MAVGKWVPLVVGLFVNAMAKGEMNIEQEIINLKQSLAQKDVEIAALQKQIGSTYTRWGRTTCPGNETTLAYSGYLAGIFYDRYDYNHSSEVNYMCISDQPTWDHYSESVSNYNLRLDGVQYKFYPHSQYLQDFLGFNVSNYGAPCAVCRALRSSSMMIPDRKDCYPGWSMEYSGYLVGAYPRNECVTGHFPYCGCHSSEYVCLDRRPEVVEGTGNYDNNKNGLFFVEVNSWNILTNVYGRELACVVCSM